MKQGLAWPAELTRHKDGSILVSFPDIPEALTEGETEAEPISQAKDCLIAALEGYIGTRRAIPRRSPARGLTKIVLPALAAAKIALYGAMRAESVENSALAVRLGVFEGVVRCLIDPDHRSHIGQIEVALHALSRRLMVVNETA